ncbi:hypothetical protein HRbin21_00092 [bacterium HR21]|nr:hypothetical protein HRbin21_00092 [bacterium HR21]
MAIAVNVGTADRWIRLIAGLLLVVLGSFRWGGWQGETWYGVAALVVGIVLVVTSWVRWCPLYALFGLRTVKKA